MTTYWTKSRWISLAVHVALALLLLIWSTSSSIHFWTFAFTDPIYVYGAVTCIDGIALLGFALHLMQVESPLASARHALPLVSALPLAFDMHKQFMHLDGPIAWVLTIGMTALLVALSFIVWRTIEQLFISPVQAAREYAERQMQTLVTVSEQMQVMQLVADGFVQKHQQRALGAVQSMQIQQDASNAVQAYARPDAQQQMQYAHAVDTQRLADADASNPVVQDASNVAMHDANADTNADAYECVKCGASNQVTDGKSAIAKRKASGRYGCPLCKQVA